MKTFYFLVILIMFTSIIPCRTIAQEDIKLMVVNRAEFPSVTSVLENSGLIKIVYAENLKIVEAVSADSLNRKIINAFTRSFQNPVNASWYACDKKNKSFVAIFEKGGRKYTALYKKNGYLEYAISRSSEKELPANNKNIIRRLYEGYMIIDVTEIITEVQSSWNICLQKGNELIFVNLVEGNLDELARTTTKNNEAISKN